MRQAAAALPTYTAADAAAFEEVAGPLGDSSPTRGPLAGLEAYDRAWIHYALFRAHREQGYAALIWVLAAGGALDCRNLRGGQWDALWVMAWPEECHCCQAGGNPRHRLPPSPFNPCMPGRTSGHGGTWSRPTRCRIPRTPATATWPPTSRCNCAALTQVDCALRSRQGSSACSPQMRRPLTPCGKVKGASTTCPRRPNVPPRPRLADAHRGVWRPGDWLGPAAGCMAGPGPGCPGHAGRHPHLHRGPAPQREQPGRGHPGRTPPGVGRGGGRRAGPAPPRPPGPPAVGRLAPPRIQGRGAVHCFVCGRRLVSGSGTMGGEGVPGQHKR